MVRTSLSVSRTFSSASWSSILVFILHVPDDENFSRDIDVIFASLSLSCLSSETRTLRVILSGISVHEVYHLAYIANVYSIYESDEKLGSNGIGNMGDQCKAGWVDAVPKRLHRC